MCKYLFVDSSVYDNVYLWLNSYEERKKLDDMVFFNPLPAITKFVREAGLEIE